MMIYHDKIEKKEINPGVVFQYLGKGKEMMVYHWNMADGKRYEIGAGDAYIIPANVPHSFIAVGDTEAIDIFHPLRTTLPDGNPA